MKPQQNRKENRQIGFLFGAALLVLFAASVFFVRRGDFPNHYAFGYEMTHTAYGSFGAWLAGVFRVRAYPVWGLMVGYLGRFFAWEFSLLSGKDASEVWLAGYTVQQAADTLSCALVNTLLMLLTIWVTWRLLVRFAGSTGQSRLRLAWLALSVSFFGALYVPGVFESFPVGTIRVSVWQNPTQPAVEACALVCFFLFADMVQNREARAQHKLGKGALRISALTGEYWLLAVLLLCSAVLKPSFYQAFIPALFVWCCMDLIATRGKSFWFDCKFGFAVLPVCALLALQYTLLFAQGDYGGVGVGLFYVWSMSVKWPLLALLLSCAFPLYCCVLFRGRFRNSPALLAAFLTFLSGLLQWSLLYTADHPNWGDFSWGANLGNRILITVCLIELLQAAKEGRVSRVQRRAAWVLFFLHVASGLTYFFYFWGTAVGELLALFA